ncbi:VWA domain-containing protein [Neobacillus vireti]|uniref:VWA domain-containing protein n=1 Tax=Neobacillus vireti TaxID=220686 RepID=UPI002FFD59C2
MNFKRTLYCMVAIVVFFLASQQQQMIVHAAENTPKLKLTVSSDKQTYKAGDDIKYKITISNSSSGDAKNVVVTSTLPDGLEAVKTNQKVDGKKQIWNIKTIKGTEEYVINFDAKAKKSGTTTKPSETNVSHDSDNKGTTATDSTSGSSPKTGDETPFMKYFVLLLVSSTILSIAVIALRKKNLKKEVASLLILSLMVPSFSHANAAILKENISATYKVSVDNKTYELVTTVQADVDNPPAEEGPFSIGITSPKEASFVANYDSLTLEGTYKGKKPSVIQYVVFLNDSLEPDSKGEVTGDKNWEIKNLKLKQGINRVIVAAHDSKGKVFQDEVSISYKDDEDNDGLSLSLETTLKTDPANPDTDGDSLPDGFEYAINLNPTLKDTDKDGILDGNEDLDADKVSNIKEMENKTDPLNDDTDNDYLKDGDEISTYSTSPLLEDTDGDTLSDGDEIDMGTNPLKKDTDGDGTLDGDETSTQKLDADLFKDVNSTDNLAPASISITGKGNFNTSVTVLDASHVPTLTSIPGVVGKPIDIKSTSSFNEATISFKIDNSLLSSRKLEDYKVVWYDDKENKVKFLTTSYDAATHTISAKTTHFSHYAAVDTPSFFEGTDGGNKSDRIEKGKADVAFVLDSTGSMGYTINNVKNNINDFVDRLDANKVDVRLGLVDYKDINADGPKSTKNHGWFTTANAFKSDLNSVRANGGGDDPESAVDALEEARLMGFTDNKAKFIVLLTDVDYHENTRFDGLTTMAEEINRLKADKISASVITSTDYSSYYKDLYTNTGGILADINGNFSTELDKLIANIGEETNEKVTVRLSNNTLVRLNKYPDKTDTKTDSDGDHVPDSKELTDKTTCDDGYGKTVECWNFKSNPAEKNSDYDIYDDEQDLEPLKEYAPSVVFLHGWTSDNKQTFGAWSPLDGVNGGTEGEKAQRAMDATSPAQVAKFSSIENQAVFKNGKGLYNSVESKVGRFSDLYTFNYPNLAHPWESSFILGKYLDNLVAAGKLKRPTAGSKPKVIFVVHSMGGLVSRYYNEKVSVKSVDVDGIITIATPHWGGNGLADYCGEHASICASAKKWSGKTYDQIASPAAGDLDPNHYELMWNFTDEEYEWVKVMSFPDRLNENFTTASKKNALYFAIGGISSYDKAPGEPVEVRYLEKELSPKNGDFTTYAHKRIMDAYFKGDSPEIPLTYDDSIVTLNSALGSAHDAGKGDDRVENHVLNFDKRYVIIGADPASSHSKLPNNSYTRTAVNYWIIKDVFSKYIEKEHLGELFKNVSEPNETE